ncbi:hypothetical protein Pelo_2131 [Pelomyxa schiedti]|nr:hypothetical protein Pelo_2131 [Pelomyxa schiedti]
MAAPVGGMGGSMGGGESGYGAPRLCYNCNQPGHMSRDCREPKRDGGMGGGMGTAVCFSCNQPGHMQRDCPMRSQGFGGGFSSGYGGSYGGGYGGSSGGGGGESRGRILAYASGATSPGICPRTATLNLNKIHRGGGMVRWSKKGGEGGGR